MSAAAGGESEGEGPPRPGGAAGLGEERRQPEAVPPLAATHQSGRVKLPAYVLLSEGAWLQLRQCAAELERVERPALEQRGAVAAMVGLLGPPQVPSKAEDPAPALAALRARLVQARDLAVTAKGEARRELQLGAAVSGAGPALQTADWVHESANHYLARVAVLERSKAGGSSSRPPPPPPPPRSAELARSQVWNSQWLAAGTKPQGLFFLGRPTTWKSLAAFLAAGLGTGLLSYLVFEPVKATRDEQHSSAQPQPQPQPPRDDK